jgi:hypothetical protein
MNYAIVYLAAILFFSTLYWVVQGHKWYTGPLIEAEINEDMSQGRSSDDEVNQKTEKHGDIIA